MGTVTYSLPRVGSTGSAGVCSREWIYSANAADIGSGLVGSQSWGSPCGRQQMPVGRGGGRGLEQVTGHREWGEKRLLRQYWGQQDHPVHHTSAPWGCPPFHNNKGRQPYVSRATSASDRDPAGCDAAVCPCNDREHSLLRGTTCPQGRGLGIPPAQDHMPPH